MVVFGNFTPLYFVWHRVITLDFDAPYFRHKQRFCDYNFLPEMGAKLGTDKKQHKKNEKSENCDFWMTLLAGIGLLMSFGFRHLFDPGPLWDPRAPQGPKMMPQCIPKGAQTTPNVPQITSTVPHNDTQSAKNCTRDANQCN